ncbi:hypothetical protein HIM_08567 [Hirsutella minnesotensis 3608]|uniref:Cytochrome P450 52A13 n=1 Tax=Hirsutella minnesotensis 3608 TaxID=1043627 RepID=A0A0F7ZH46_9HYPO|nr:hypothetical protein HIM_08567 [Hirsutella minnesotensis 3608]
MFFLGFLGFLICLVWIRHRVKDVLIRQAGGVRAPVLAGNLLTATRFYYGVGKHQFYNRLPAWCNEALDDASGSRHFAEFSLTGKKRVLITREPEQIKAILATNFANFGHGPQWCRLWRPFLGNGIFAADGQTWHDSRSMIRPMFVRDRLRNLAIFNSCTEKLISKLPASGVTVDMKDLLYRWALDTASEFLWGSNVNSLDHPCNEVASAMSVAQRIQMFIFVLNPIAPLIPKGAYFDAIAKIEAFIQPVIERAVSLPDHELEELSDADAQYTFLHSIARRSKDRKKIRDQIMSVLFAGRDTTAATMSWVIYEMSNRPESWARLRREVLELLGVDRMPSYENLKSLKFVSNVLNETLRLHPAVPLNMRQALQTTRIPGIPGEPDVVLLKGDTVTIHTLGIHARRDLYPDVSEKFANPAIFSPERWDHWVPKPWTFLPFSGGPRVCIGQNFALTEMAFCLVRLAQRFEKIEYRGDWKAQFRQTELIGTPGLGVPVALFEPKEAT